LLNDIKKLISSKTTEWKSRKSSLKTLQRLTVEKKLTCYQLPIVREGLILQLTELRSNLVIEVCNTLSTFVQCIEEKCDEFFADGVISQVATLTGQSIKCMAAAGSKCLGSIAKSELPKTLTVIINRAETEKHSKVQSECVKFVATAISSWDTKSISTFSEKIKKCIRTGLAGKAAGVRINAKEVYMAFKKKCPKEAKNLYDSLQSSEKRRLGGSKKGGQRSGFRNRIRALRAMKMKKKAAVTEAEKEEKVPTKELTMTKTSINSKEVETSPSSLSAGGSSSGRTSFCSIASSVTAPVPKMEIDNGLSVSVES